MPNIICVISGFRSGVHESCALLGCYATLIRENLSVPSSRVPKRR